MKLKFVSELIQIASLRFIKALEGSEDYIGYLLNLISISVTITVKFNFNQSFLVMICLLKKIYIIFRVCT